MKEACGEHVFRSIHRLARRMDLGDERIAKEFNLSTNQLSTLRWLSRLGGQAQLGKLADGVAISRSSMTAIVDRLVEAGCVERQRSVTDRRRVNVELTQHGSKLACRMPEPLLVQLGRRLQALIDDDPTETADHLLHLIEVLELSAAPILTFHSKESDPSSSLVGHPKG